MMRRREFLQPTSLLPRQQRAQCLRKRHARQMFTARDAIEPGQNVLIVEDLLATGGTMEATVKLVRQLGARIVGLAFAVELDLLNGRDRFKEYDVFSLLHYSE